MQADGIEPFHLVRLKFLEKGNQLTMMLPKEKLLIWALVDNLLLAPSLGHLKTGISNVC